MGARSWLLFPALCLAAPCLASCGSEAVEDRTKVLGHVSSQVILPAVRDFAAASETLRTATVTHCDKPSLARLTRARQAWREARQAYRETIAFSFGPAEDQLLAGAVDFWPVRTADVERAVAAAERPLDEYLETLGVSARGLPALEYLLFASQGANEESSDLGPGLRCDYAVALAQDIEARARRLRTDWSGTEGFAAALAEAGTGASSIDSTQAGVDLLLNGLIAALVELTDRTLAVPLGDKSGGTPEPERAESYYSGNSVPDYLAALGGVRAIWVGAREGDRGKGITLLVRRYRRDFDEALRAQFDRVEGRVQDLEAPISEAVLDDPERVREALIGARELRRMVTTDVTQIIGGTLTFSDNDGD